MSLINSLKEELEYLGVSKKKNIIKAETIKSFTEKNQVVAPVFLKNEIRNSESNISSTKNERISKPKISTENYNHKANSPFLAKQQQQQQQQQQQTTTKIKRKKMTRKKNEN